MQAAVEAGKTQLKSMHNNLAEINRKLEKAKASLNEQREYRAMMIQEIEELGNQLKYH